MKGDDSNKNINTNSKHITTSINLQLEKEPSDHSRFLTIHANHVLALGGEEGVITALPINSSANDNDEQLPRVIKQYDDEVKALAFSDDGKRVAVGYEDGNIVIYVYSNDDLVSNHNRRENDNGSDNYHPFICKKKSKNTNNDNNDDDDDVDDAFFTQSSQTDGADDYDAAFKNQQPTFSLEHRFEAPIRHLQFQPMQNKPNTNNQKYYLAIAAESSPGFMIVDVTTENSSSSNKYLDDEAKTAYREGGVRSVSFSPHNNGHIITTLGMDGRMSYWSTEGNDPTLDWELIHSDSHKIVNKADMGGFADVADRSLYPVWSTCGTFLGIPGSEELKFRKMEDGDDSWYQKNRMVLNMALASSSKKDGHDDDDDDDDDDDGSSIVGMAFDPKNEGYVVTSSRDGTVSLWKINKERKENEPQGQFIKEILRNESMCTHILWHQNSQSKDECIFLALQNGTMISLKGRDHFIPNEDVAPPPPPTAAALYQKKNSIDANQESQVSFGEDLNEDVTALVTQPVEERHAQTDEKKPSEEYDMDDYGDNDEDEDEDDFDSTSRSDKNKFVSDEAEENINNNDVDDESQFDDVIVPPNNTQDTEQMSGSDKILPNPRDNDDVPMAGNENVMDQDDFAGLDDNNYVDDVASVRSIVRPQDSFAPSSTPYGERTILCWNHVGTITLRHETDSSITDSSINIDIDFTDVMTNRPIKFRDNMQFVMGSLGDEGAIFATDLLDNVDDDIDDNVIDALDGLNGMSEATKNVVKRSERRSGKIRATGSCVYFHRFNTFGSLKNKDWFVTLHAGEKVISCATGDGWNAVATSRRFLRSFTSGGVQGPVIWLKGEPVTMVGRGYFLAVFYHESNPSIDKTQHLGYSLYDGRNMREISSGSVAAISPGSFLTWVGFSNDFALSVMDSNGILSMLMSMKSEESDEVASFSWLPMLDTFGLKKSREDSFWPVCVQNGKLICVPLKGVPHPNPTRRPLTTSLQLRMPLARDTKDKIYGLEEVSVRADLALNHKNYLNDFMVNCGENEQDLQEEYTEMCTQVDRITLRLFHRMIEAGKVESALDLTRRLYQEESFEAAILIADKSNQRKLSDHIYSIKGEKFSRFEEDQYMDEDAESYGDGSVNTFTNNRAPEESLMKVSPEPPNSRNKRKLNVEHSEKPKCRKRVNPFATNTRKSPGKSPPPPKSALKKPTLSRLSTFSSQSRQLNRASKEIL